MNDAQRQFAEWLCREIPEGTIIGNANWWAPRIWNAVLRAQATPEPVEIGESRAEGVVWFKVNPHGWPVGTKFYAHPPEHTTAAEKHGCHGGENATNHDAVGVPDVAELVNRFPELNMSNYGTDGVDRLQAWGLEAADALTAQQEQLAQKLKDVVGLTGLLAKEKRLTEEQQEQLRYKTLSLESALRQLALNDERIAALEAWRVSAIDVLQRLKPSTHFIGCDVIDGSSHCLLCRVENLKETP